MTSDNRHRIKSIWYFGKKYVPMFLIAEICILISYAISVLLPINLTKLTDEVLYGGKYSLLPEIIRNYVLMFLIATVRDIGSVTGSDGVTLLKMWRVFVPSGDRTLQRHSHICFEITYVNSGEGVYTVGERQYPMEPGDMFIFGSNEQHCITDISENGL